MNERERMAGRMADGWQRDACHYCLITAEYVDGDRLRWVNRQRNVCSRSQCLRRFADEVTRALGRAARPAAKKRTPAEVHAVILEERRAKRRQYRLAARARRKGNAA